MKDTSSLIKENVCQSQISFNIDSPDHDNSNIKSLKSKHKKQLILFCILTAIFVAILTNIDRIINELNNNNNNNNNYNDDISFDYIIIGGGISGLSQMEFINYNDPNKRIKKLLIEKEDRIGGRAFSLNVSYLNETITIEHGAAMRFNWNEWIYKLLSYLNLCNDFITMNNSPNENNREYLFRNIRYNESIRNYTLSDYFNQIFNFASNDNSVNLQLIRQEFYDENNNGLAPQTYQESFECLYNWTFRGAPIISYSLYSIWKSVFNVTMEYVDENQRFNSINLLDRNTDFCDMESFFPWTFMEQPQNLTAGSMTLRGGFNMITQRIYKKLVNDSVEMNQFLMNYEVVSIDYNDNKDNVSMRKYLVTMKNVQNNSDVHRYYTDNIVLAIPPMNLKQLLSQIIPFCDYSKNNICYKINERVYDLIYSKTEPDYAYKVNLIYNNYYEWMEKFNITRYVQSRTDLDIREFYVDDTWRDNNLFSILLYSRKIQAKRLYYLQESGNLYEFDENIIVSHYDNNTNIRYQASSKLLVDSVLNELAQLLDINRDELEYPLAAFALSFGLNESGFDGLYRWKVNAKSYQYTKNILNPLKSENIYIISCDYSRSISNHQGAIYAAIQNTVENLNMSNPLENIDICWV